MHTLTLNGRCYNMLPIGPQQGYGSEPLDLALDSTAFMPIDVYSLGHSEGEARPEREPLWFPGSFEIEREIMQKRISPCLAAARRIGMPVIYVNNSNPSVRADALAHHEYARIARHLLGQPLARRFHKGHLTHGSTPPGSRDGGWPSPGGAAGSVRRRWSPPPPASAHSPQSRRSRPGWRVRPAAGVL